MQYRSFTVSQKIYYLHFFQAIFIFAIMIRNLIKHIILLSVALMSAYTLYAANSPISREMKIEYLKDRIADQNYTPAMKLALYDSLIAVYGKNVPASVLFGKGQLCIDIADYEGALKIFNRMEKCVPLDSISTYCNLMINKSATSYYLSKKGEALRSIQKLIETPKPDSLRYIDVKCHILLSHIFGDNDLAEDALKQINEADKIFALLNTEITDPTQLNITHTQLYYAKTCYALSQKKYNEAFSLLQDAKRIARDDALRGDLIGEMGRVYACMGDTVAAEHFYREALTSNSIHYNNLIHLIGFVNLLIDSGRVDEALKIIESRKQLINSLNEGMSRQSILRMYYKLYMALGNKEMALKTLDEAAELGDSIAYAQSSIYVYEMARERDARLAELEKEKAQGSSHVKSIVIAVLIVVLSAIALFAIVGWRKLKRRRHEKECLEIKLSDIHSDHRKVVEAKDQSLEQRNQELTSMSLRMAYLSEGLDAIKKMCVTTRTSPKESLDAIRKIVRNLESQVNVWEMFRSYFEQVNQRFFDNLYKLYPSLTPAEVKMCAFILINLTTKEIAELTNRSVRTVDAIKYNLRKKMGITGSWSSEAWMRSISAADEADLEMLRNATAPAEKQTVGEPT